MTFHSCGHRTRPRHTGETTQNPHARRCTVAILLRNRFSFSANSDDRRRPRHAFVRCQHPPLITSQPRRAVAEAPDISSREHHKNPAKSSTKNANWLAPAVNRCYVFRYGSSDQCDEKNGGRSRVHSADHRRRRKRGCPAALGRCAHATRAARCLSRVLASSASAWNKSRRRARLVAAGRGAV